jgi:hypothetical protein
MTFLISRIASVTVLGDGDHVRSPCSASCPVADNDAGPVPLAGGGSVSGGRSVPIGMICVTTAYVMVLALVAPIRRLLLGGDPHAKSPSP